MARAPSGALTPRVCLLTTIMSTTSVADTHTNRIDAAEESKRLASGLDAAAKEVESAAKVCPGVHRASQ